MRAQWNRTTPLVNLPPAALNELIQPALPGQMVAASEPAAGGLANTNLKLRLAPSGQTVLLGFHVRSAAAGALEHTVHQRLAGRVWEFAFSGSPFFDLGNLLRPPLGRRPGFAPAVCQGYTSAGGRLPPQWRQMSRLADLLAWADFLNRPNTGATLIRDAQTVIRDTIARAH